MNAKANEGEATMSKQDDRAMLEALLAASTKPVTKAEAAPMDASLSASRIIAAEAKTKVEKRLEERTYAEKKPRKRVKRNWEAQRRYDEIHGTSNGYDERIEEARAMRDYEAGDY